MFKKWIIDHDEDLKKTRAREKAFFKKLDDNIEFLKASLNLGPTNYTLPDYFELVQGLPDWSIYESLICRDESLPMRCFILRYVTSVKVGRGRSTGEDFYLVGLATLKESYPHTLIYPETLKEKLADLFIKAEVDFTHSKKFSRRFYTLTKDEGMLRTLLYDKDLDALRKYKTLELELKGNLCFFRQNRKPFEKNEALVFCELSRAIHKAFG